MIGIGGIGIGGGGIGGGSGFGFDGGSGSGIGIGGGSGGGIGFDGGSSSGSGGGGGTILVPQTPTSFANYVANNTGFSLSNGTLNLSSANSLEFFAKNSEIQTLNSSLFSNIINLGPIPFVQSVESAFEGTLRVQNINFNSGSIVTNMDSFVNNSNVKSINTEVLGLADLSPLPLISSVNYSFANTQNISKVVIPQTNLVYLNGFAKNSNISSINSEIPNTVDLSGAIHAQTYNETFRNTQNIKSVNLALAAVSQMRGTFQNSKASQVNSSKPKTADLSAIAQKIDAENLFKDTTQIEYVKINLSKIRNASGMFENSKIKTVYFIN